MKNETVQVSRNEILSALNQIGHGRLSIYNDVALRAVKYEPELFAHLIAWNAKKTEVRDQKVAFPILALRGDKDDELFENAAAHLCLLDPRDLLRALSFHRGLSAGELVEFETTQKGLKKERKSINVKFSALPTQGGSRWVKTAVQLYLREREKNKRWWDAVALQHRDSLKTLYAQNHVKPSSYAQKILFDRVYPVTSVFHAVSQLKYMKADEAAGAILNFRIPFLIAIGALGGIKDKSDILLALIERMSGSELINNTTMLQKAGVFESPILKSAFDNAVNRMKKDKRVSTLKAGKAASVITDEKIAKKLESIQEDRLMKLGSIDGDWLVLGDRSGSMTYAIDLARNVASLIAKQVSGKVYLVFFNTAPNFFDVSNKTLEEIKELTKRITASGGTSIGCGLQYLLEKNIFVNGIAICSDGGDNTNPYFHDTYSKYVKKMNVEPTVYLFHVQGDRDDLSKLCAANKIQIEKKDLTKNVDYYSLPSIISTLRTNRFSLIDDIMETSLLTFKDVFAKNN